jgi:2-keto-4-pentenoate hydratase/2-oxohepta-3-ene-1,7-dioic acid hydratase in catechol pathway
MRIVSLRKSDGVGLGLVLGDEVADLAATSPDLPSTLPDLLAGPGLEALEPIAARAPRVALETADLGPPVHRPPKFLAIGLNYAAHVEESGSQPPAHQLWFNKQSTCVVGPHDAIEIPRVAPDLVDYEGELGFVIGERCRHVAADRARDVIAGWLVVDDVSVRDWQLRTPTMTMGKSFDTHGPIGPWLTTDDEVDDPHALGLRTWVDGKLVQDARTDDLIFDCWEMIEHLSSAFTLEPGDVIATGTPAGVGIAKQPPAMLRAGNVVRVEIEGLGTLENPVIDEPT